MTEVPNNDFRDWILWKVDNDTLVYDESIHSDEINNLSKIQKARYDIALEEMLMSGALYKVPKESKYILTSLGKEVLENGSFTVWSPKISSDLNLNKKFSKSERTSNIATKISVGVGIGTLLVLIAQVVIDLIIPKTIQGRVQVQTEETLNQELQSLKTKMDSQTVSLHSLEVEYHKISKKLDSTYHKNLKVNK